MISETSKITSTKSEKYPWKATGAVQLSAYFTYYRDPAGGFIRDTKGLPYGAITALPPDEEENRTGISWQISSFRFGKILFTDDFFRAKEFPDGRWEYTNACLTEQAAVEKLFAALMDYLQKIATI